MIKYFTKPLFFTFSLLAFIGQIVQAQPKKNPKPNVNKVKPVVKPTSEPAAAKLTPVADPRGSQGGGALFNDISSEKSKTTFKAAPNKSDSLVKIYAASVEVGEREAFKEPFIVVAPEDQENKDRFIKICKLAISYPKGPKAVWIKDTKDKEILALTINSQAVLDMVLRSKEFVGLQSYIYVGSKQVSDSKDPYIQNLNSEKSLYKMIVMRNVDFLPLAEEVNTTPAQLEAR